MKSKQIFYLCAILLVFLSAILTEVELPESVFDDIDHHIKLNSPEQLNDLLTTTDTTYLVYYYKKSSKSSKIGASLLKRISEKLESLAQIALVNCDSDNAQAFKYCKIDDPNKDSFPRITVHRPPDYRENPYTKEVSKHEEKIIPNGSISETVLQNFITSNIPSTRTLSLNTDNIEGFLK